MLTTKNMTQKEPVSENPVVSKEPVAETTSLKTKKYKIRDGVNAKLVIGGKWMSHKKGQEIPVKEAMLWEAVLVEAKKPDGEPEGRIYTEDEKAYIAKKEAENKARDKAEAELNARELKKADAQKKAKLAKSKK